MQVQPSDKKKTLISFIIPYYNIPADMLMECVRSIVATDLHDEEYEIVIVDDGSDNDLEETIRKSIVSRIVYVRQGNQGLSGARNTGINHSCGEYIQFVDSDDALISYNYNRCIEIIRNNYPDILLFRHSRSVTCSKTTHKSLQTSGAEFMKHHNLRASACGYLFRRDLLDGQRFSQGILHEDEEFSPLLILKAKSLISTDIEAYYYRKRPGSIIQTTDHQWALRRLNDKLGVISRLNATLSSLSEPQFSALQRRVDQLSMDLLYESWIMTHSRSIIRHYVQHLRTLSLFPLRNKPYTWKYRIFRIISKTFFN